MNQLDRRSFLATTAGAALLTAAPALAQPAGEDAKLRTMLDQYLRGPGGREPPPRHLARPRQGPARAR